MPFSSSDLPEISRGRDFHREHRPALTTDGASMGLLRAHLRRAKACYLVGIVVAVPLSITRGVPPRLKSLRASARLQSRTSSPASIDICLCAPLKAAQRDALYGELHYAGLGETTDVLGKRYTGRPGVQHQAGLDDGCGPAGMPAGMPATSPGFAQAEMAMAKRQAGQWRQLS